MSEETLVMEQWCTKVLGDFLYQWSSESQLLTKRRKGSSISEVIAVIEDPQHIDKHIIQDFRPS